MGHDKLRKFAENETFACLVQPSAAQILARGYADLQPHPVRGRWNDFFGSLPYAVSCSTDSPLTLEVGCGKGEYTIALAGRFQQERFVGIDIKGARLWKGAKYATLNKIPNAAFLRTKVEFLPALFAEGEVSQIWLTFSDPQYKSPNSRLCSPVFLEKYRTIMKAGGVVHLKTDSRFLYEYALAVCVRNRLRIYAATTDLYGGPRDQAPELYEIRTFYEEMFLSQGYKINYLCFGIDCDGPFLPPDGFDEKYWRRKEGPRVLFGHDSAETKRQKSKQSEYAQSEE